MNQRLVSVKNFVSRNERKILYVALGFTAAGTWLMFRNQRVTNEFLREHNLLEEFYYLAED